MKKILFTITLILLSCVGLWSENSFRVIKMTEDNIQLQFHLDKYKFIESNKDGNPYQFIEFTDIDYDNINEKGKPLLPFFTKIIGLPPDGNLSAKIIYERHKTIENKHISCNPTYVEERDKQVLKYIESSQVYKSHSYFPGKIIESDVEGYAGDRYLGSVRIFPVQFNPADKKLKIYTDITISINITGNKKGTYSPTGENTNFLDNVADNLILNNQYSKNWKKEREMSTSPKSGEDENVINKFKLIIDKKGIYKVTYAFLKDTISFWQDSLQADYQFDFDIDTIDPQNLELSNKGVPVPIYFYGEDDGSFDAGDYFEFYADINHGQNCFYDNYSWENCYWLEYKDYPGARMAVEDCGLYEIDPHNYKKPYYFDTTVHLEKQNKYYKLSEVEPVREDLWFWTSVSAPNIRNISFTLHNPKLGTNTLRTTAKISLSGNSYWKSDSPNENAGKHHTIIYINTSQVGDAEWGGRYAPYHGQEKETIIGTMSNDKLNDGKNVVYISMPGDTQADQDVILLDYIDLTYWREYIPYDDILEFNKPSTSYYGPGLYQFEITGFQTSNIDIYKVGVSKLENVSIESTMPNGGPPFIVKFQDEVIDNNTKYIAINDEKKLVPKLVTPDIPPKNYYANLHDTSNLADYIIISPRNFLNCEAIPEFISHWQEYGNLTVMPVALEDIFDEFNYGIRSAQAIKDFLKYAYNNWQEPRVKYVLLLGDGSSDERCSSPYREYNIIPTKVSWAFELGATVDDNWFACIVGDDELPDLSISRISVWEKEQVPQVIEKTIHYNTEPNFDDVWRNRCALIAGSDVSFENQNERLKEEYIPNTYRVSRMYPFRSHDNPYWDNNLKKYIDDGAAYIQYMGHGASHVWSGLNLVSVGDIETLNNDNYPIIVSLACYTSDFNNLKCGSLGEGFTLEPGKGAIGFFGAAGKSHAGAIEDYSALILNNIFNRGMRNFADIITLSKIEYSLKHGGSNDDTKAFVCCSNYMGDPAINIVLPKKKLNINLNSHEFVCGDTVHIFINNQDITVNNVAYYVTDENDLIPDPYYEGRMKQVELSDMERENYNPAGYKFVIDTTQAESEFTRIVRSYAYDDTSDYIGYTKFTVGKSAIFDIATDPSIPCLGDSVTISAKVYDKNGIDTVKCIWWTNFSEKDTIPMQQTGDSLTFVTERQIDAFYDQKTVFYYIEVVDNNLNPPISSETMQYKVAGPDIKVEGFEPAIVGTSPSFEVELFNSGGIVSPPTIVVIKNKDNDTIISECSVDSLLPMKKEKYFADCPLLPGIYNLIAFANPDTSFLEISYPDTMSRVFHINNFIISPDSQSVYPSLDSNLVVTFPSGIVDDSCYFCINQYEDSLETTQPDISQILLQNGEEVSYEIAAFDSSQLNNGFFKKDIGLKFNYSKTDTLTQSLESQGNFKIYCYNFKFKHWFLVGGNLNPTEDNVSYTFVTRPGIYSLFQNNDFTPPQIDVNVEGQEFTNGEYVDNRATFSFIIQDDNGINPEKIKLFLSGDTISTYSVSAQNLNSVSVKHQIDVDVGSYTFTISAMDANGNYQEKVINFSVQKEFNIIHIGNYPNPVYTSTVDPNNEGNTRFTYTLTDDADNVSIKIYTVSGRLVNTLFDLATTVGYHEYPRKEMGWKCIDKDGRKLANGVYFYKIVATKGKKKIEKIKKLAILR